MRFITITESQKCRLFEAYDGKFSFDDLDDYDKDGMFDYCVKHLGQPFSNGSSRVVFTLSDNMVLKLAYGNYRFIGARIEQNKREYELCESFKSPLLPRVYGHGENFEYIVSENVVPAEETDFEKILGIPWSDAWMQHTERFRDGFSKHGGDEHVGYDKYFDNLKDLYEPYFKPSVNDCLRFIEDFVVRGYDIDKIDNDGWLYHTVDSTPWLTEVLRLVDKTKMCDLDNSIDNFGIVNRDGKPSIVILDCGLNENIWHKYYK